MWQIKAEIVADSKSIHGHRITSMILTYPRMIHAEMCRHRMHSRNSASSRAIPFEKMVQEVEKDPFIPIAWQKDHKGMQGTEYATYPDTEDFKSIWLEARDNAVKSAQLMQTGNVKLTKQLCNRLLEPFKWHTELITATEWNNFFELRCPKYSDGYTTYYSRKDFLDSPHIERENYPAIDNDSEWIKYSSSGAEIHIQLLAEKMWDAMNESTPNQLKSGEWHIPFGGKFDYSKFVMLEPEDKSEDIFDKLELKISTARCARLSYETHDGEIDYEKDIKLHDKLLEKQHASPFEHIAKSMSDEEHIEFIQGRLEYDSCNDEDDVGLQVNFMSEHYPSVKHGWCKNFRGFISYRYFTGI